jgi:hypothetical protein
MNSNEHAGSLAANYVLDEPPQLTAGDLELGVIKQGKDQRELRDRFAMAALPTAMHWVVKAPQTVAEMGGDTSSVIAATAYDIADAILAERAKRS